MRCAPRSRWSRALHQKLIGVFGADGHAGVALVGPELTELLRQRRVHVLRTSDRELAPRGRAHELDRILLREAEVDEELLVVDLDRELLGLDRLLERQGE